MSNEWMRMIVNMLVYLAILSAEVNMRGV